ncbi:MAG: hypothetical protein ABL890_04205 [Candidatus Peribacteraceae bacterium]
MRATLSSLFVLSLIGVALAGSDFLFKERTTTAASTTSGDITSSASSNIGTAPSIIKKGSSTQKTSGVQIDSVFQSLQLIEKETNEQSLIEQAAGAGASVKKVVLLRNNDRAYFFAMIQGATVKKTFATLKQQLQELFSANLKELKDQTITSETGPPVDMLSFIDPAISKEPLLFLRVRDRLYELRVAGNGQELLDALVRELSK